MSQVRGRSSPRVARGMASCWSEKTRTAGFRQRRAQRPAQRRANNPFYPFCQTTWRCQIGVSEFANRRHEGVAADRSPMSGQRLRRGRERDRYFANVPGRSTAFVAWKVSMNVCELELLNPKDGKGAQRATVDARRGIPRCTSRPQSYGSPERRTGPHQRSALPSERLLLDEAGTQPLVDLAFERRAVVVVLVDLTGQLDELRTEVATALTAADFVLYVPQHLVDRTQLGRQRIEGSGRQNCPVAGRRTGRPVPRALGGGRRAHGWRPCASRPASARFPRAALRAGVFCADTPQQKTAAHSSRTRQ